MNPTKPTGLESLSDVELKDLIQWSTKERADAQKLLLLAKTEKRRRVHERAKRP